MRVPEGLAAAVARGRRDRGAGRRRAGDASQSPPARAPAPPHGAPAACRGTGAARGHGPEARPRHVRAGGCAAGRRRARGGPAASRGTPPPPPPPPASSYETMIVLRPDMTEEERDGELAKFEAFLKREAAHDISALVRGSPQRLAYPIKGYWEGVYVLYRYGAKRATSQAVQRLLSAPPVGAETNVLRHMTFVA